MHAERGDFTGNSADMQRGARQVMFSSFYIPWRLTHVLFPSARKSMACNRPARRLVR